MRSSSAIEGAGDERFAKLVQEIEDWKSDSIIVIKSLEESHNAEHERIRNELNDMEARKDKYKSYFNQLEVHLNEEEEACRAESEAFEKVRNEYNEQVKELSELENKSPTRVCRKNSRRPPSLLGQKLKRCKCGSRWLSKTYALLLERL